MMEEKLLKTGTTTLGIICKDGVVLAAERKATMGYLVASKNAEKILPLNSRLAMTTAGLVGDAQAIERIMKAELKLYEYQEERKPSVRAAAYLLANLLYSRRYYPFYVQLLVGGFDDKPRLYSFDPSGSIQEENEFFSTGSGSPIALGVLEEKFKKGVTVEEAKKMAAKAIKSAVQRDIASGGSGIDIMVIDKDGIKKVKDSEVQELAG
ncbi:MAG: archaeal proteasome endopeptidase complex subunit beta [Candidatus Aenigmarchaeota archaeon]|nr:archaeal proteasome endopeptidase complex subunit beta [Candidatus Aenigmarchaeota archaeon]